MNLRTPLLALGLSLTAASAFAAAPGQSTAAPAKPAATAAKSTEGKHDKQDCQKKDKNGRCEQSAKAKH